MVEAIGTMRVAARTQEYRRYFVPLCMRWRFARADISPKIEPFLQTARQNVADLLHFGAGCCIAVKLYFPMG